MYPRDQHFCDKRKFKRPNMAFWYNTDKKKVCIYINTILFYTFDINFQTIYKHNFDFGKNFVTKKLVSRNHSYRKCALRKVWISDTQYTTIGYQKSTAIIWLTHRNFFTGLWSEMKSVTHSRHFFCSNILIHAVVAIQKTKRTGHFTYIFL